MVKHKLCVRSKYDHGLLLGWVVGEKKNELVNRRMQLPIELVNICYEIAITSKYRPNDFRP